jgi:hypothetical protein
MSIEYAIKSERGLVLVVWDGRVTTAAWLTHLRRLFADPQYGSCTLQLTDLRAAKISPKINGPAIGRVIEFVASQRTLVARKRIAIIAGADWDRPKDFEARVQEYVARAIVFNALDTACSWLGQEAAQVTREIDELRRRIRAKP